MKILFNKKVILFLIISSIISNSITLYQNNKYDKLYSFEESEKINIIAKVVSNKEEKETIDRYEIKVEMVNGDTRYRNTKLYLCVKNNKNINLDYGDKIKICGSFNLPEGNRNYKGFDYREYLKTLKLYGRINSDNIKVLSKNENNIISTISNKIFLNLKERVENALDKEKASLILGIVLGYTDEISEDIRENFSESNISHVLAVSGMHIGYVVGFVKYFFDILLGKRKSKIFTSVFVVFYMFLTGFSPSVVRAGISAMVVLMAGVVHRKSDLWNNIFLSMLILLIYNPFLIKSVGLLLSFSGTIGIIVLQKSIIKCIERIEENYKYKNRRRKRLKINNNIIKVYKIFKESFAMTIAATIMITPIMGYVFNKIALTSLIIGILISLIIGPFIIIYFIFIISINFIEIEIFTKIIDISISIILKITYIGSKMFLRNIYVVTPYIIEIIIYYFVIFACNYLINIYYSKELTITQKRVKNTISLIKYKFNQNKKKFVSIILISCLICVSVYRIPKDLEIYFIDVGQGDSTLIITPNKKKILVDGGGSEYGSYDVGEKILLPYLLDRRIKKLDYVIISHFDTDHVGGILTVLEKLEIDNVIISKQYEDSDNYRKFIEIVRREKIDIVIVNKGDILNIEKDITIKILHPNSKGFISENPLNNNSIVFNLIYDQFSMLFTGDIEEIAEKQILKEYKNKKQLKANILKVAHHGSNSSSIEEFLEEVNPQIALIGVGKNNLYGHPSNNVIDRLNKLKIKIYRTDENGEINISVNRNGGMKLRKFN